MKITFIGHACFLIEDNAGHRLAVDPYQKGSVPGLAYHGLTADEVICSHGHYDHDDAAGVRRPDTVWNGRFDVTSVSSFHDGVRSCIWATSVVSLPLRSLIR